ncbi:acyl carrier protein [Streptomyces lonarensis]|uniref:Acyl carrier protein n=1 Tax=Streptomyces lonarensis TaxID=700599 RepID=A0A7X6D051_9ACTN|nr:acyl carrier protein [Streptomyces lonarensis]NJQ05644.1 acyl carrier protein [Streptomyces lonarensis]
MDDTTATTPGTEDRVRQVLLSVLGDSVDVSLVDTDTDLWSMGLDSLRCVRLMVALEDEFAIEFPDELLTRETFSSVRRMSDAVAGTAAR